MRSLYCYIYKNIEIACLLHVIGQLDVYARKYL